MTGPTESATASDLVEVEPGSFEGGLRGATVRGTAWTALSRISQQVVQLGISVVLARLLLPREYGLIGMVAVFTGLAVPLVDSGFSWALIQRARLTAAHLATAFWLNVGAGAVFAALAAAFAPLIARFYGQPEIEVIMPVVGLSALLGSFGNVQLAILERRMLFRRIAFVENGALVAGGVAGIACAVSGLGVWSLVVFSLVSNAVESALLWLLGDWRPTGTFDRTAFRELWSFGGNILGAQTINYWNRNADNLLIGRFVGAGGLGLYTRAYSLVLLQLTQVSLVVGRTLFPALSRMQGDVARVRRAYLRAVGVIAFVTFPIATGLFVAARPFVLTLLGSRWIGVVPFIQILAIAAVSDSIGMTTGAIFQSQGRADWQFRWQLFAGATIITSFAIGVHWGAEGVAAAYAIASLCLRYPGFAIAGRLIGMSFLDVVRTIWPVLVAALLSAGAAWIAGRLVRTEPAGVQLLVEVAAATATYLACAHVGRLEPYRELRDFLLRRAPATSVGVPKL